MVSAYIPRQKSWKSLLIALVVVLGLSWLSSFIVQAHMPWYHGLQKPSFTPPDWSFSVVWPLLYIMMTVAAWLIWHQPVRKPRQLARARALFVVQLLLNLAWTPVFFGLQNPLWGLGWIILVWCAVVATMLQFWRIHAVAGLLFVPYLCWVSFATLLNYRIVVLN